MSVPGPYDVFVYGTLMVPEVLQLVLGRVPLGIEATLAGYKRHALLDEVYPAMVTETEATPVPQVSGRLLRELTDSELQKLDAYEGPMYGRVTAPVVTEEGNGLAFAYVLHDEFRHLLTANDWDPQTFLRRDLQRFLQQLRSDAG